jgi:hypothetical protein
LGVSLETTCNCACSISFFKSIIEFTICDWQFLMSIGLSSIIWFQICLSESGAPFFVESWMGSKESFFAVTSEVCRSSSIKISLISHEILWHESIVSLLEPILLTKASSSDFSKEDGFQKTHNRFMSQDFMTDQRDFDRTRPTYFRGYGKETFLRPHPALYEEWSTTFRKTYLKPNNRAKPNAH